MATRERLVQGLPVSVRTLRVAGAPTAVLEGGEGAPLVLLHGPGENAGKWLRVIPDLVRTHRVIAPDLPGHGESGSIEGAVEGMIGWLDDLIERTCAAPPALVGQILGGAIAARFAAQHSDRISHLVLVDALGLAPFRPAPEFGAALGAFLSHPDEATYDDLWSRCAFDLGRLRRDLGERWDWLKAYNLDRVQVPELKSFQQGLMAQFGLPAIPPEELGAIRAPTALIWGRHDLATPLAIAEAAAARYRWPLHVIDDAADDPAIEQPAKFASALRMAVVHTATPQAAVRAVY